MRRAELDTGRILAIDPTSRGFGYVVLEGHHLVDWGAATLGRVDHEQRCLHYIERLIKRYQPDQLITEDIHAAGCRRCERIKQLITKAGLMAGNHGMRWKTVAAASIPKTLGLNQRANKSRVAQVVIGQLLQLRPWLPPPRKPWMSEDPRQAILDAAAFVLSVLQPNRQK